MSVYVCENVYIIVRLCSDFMPLILHASAHQGDSMPTLSGKDS